MKDAIKEFTSNLDQLKKNGAECALKGIVPPLECYEHIHGPVGQEEAKAANKPFKPKPRKNQPAKADKPG